MDLLNISNLIISYFKTIPINYLHSFGYVFVFLSAFFEAIPILGILLPGQTIIIISGFLSYQGFMDLYLLLIISSIGAILGDLISFYIGKKYGFKFIKKHGKYILINEKRNKIIKKLIKTNLGKTIFIGRFNSVTRAFTPFIAGSMEIKISRFLFYNIITGIFWASTWVLVGYFAGKSFVIVTKDLSYGILIISILFILSLILYNHFKKNKKLEDKINN